MKIHFQFHFFAIWSTPASILPITAWTAPASSWFPSELAMIFHIDPRCFGPFGKLYNKFDFNCLLRFLLFLLVSKLLELTLKITQYISQKLKNWGNIHIWGLLILSFIKSSFKTIRYFFSFYVWSVNSLSFGSDMCAVFIL